MNTVLVNNWLNHMGGYRASRALNERRLSYRMSYVQDAKKNAAGHREQDKLRHAIHRAKEQEMIFHIACAKLSELYRDALTTRYVHDQRGIEPELISDAIDALTNELNHMEQSGVIQFRVIEGYVILQYVHQRTA
ncbi:DNA-directed RNA polymerase [Paenibacillus apiarius]|uniref:DNA-directed RNA polymerase n=1 Tax=Paenibacillus apiarius TaxID=46240 RepID=UPI0019811886|nr:DNA-directed RNA polymerase [Paenibacillus apiarius]MBN3522725.1 DNA-directed RNA polymerase [Paenibacillus apiarius]